MKNPNIYTHENCKNALITSLKWTKGVHLATGSLGNLNTNYQRFTWSIEQNIEPKGITLIPDGEEKAYQSWKQKLNQLKDYGSQKHRYDIKDFVGDYYRSRGYSQQWINQKQPDITDIFEGEARGELEKGMPESMPIEPIETPQNQRTAPKGTELPEIKESLPETTEIRPIESFEPMVAVNPKDPKDTITISPIEQYLDQPIIQDLIAKGEIENIEYYGRVDYWNAPEFYRYEVLGNPKETELEHLAYEQISKEFGINEPTIAVEPPP